MHSLLGPLIHVLDVQCQLVVLLVITVSHDLPREPLILLFENLLVSTLLRLLQVHHVVVQHLQFTSGSITIVIVLQTATVVPVHWH